MMRQKVEREDLQTSNLVYGWSVKTRIIDERLDLQGQRSSSRCHVVRLTNVGP